MGVNKVFLTGYTPHPKLNNDQRLPHIATKVGKQIEKTALGAQNYQKWQYVENIESAIEEALSAGYVVCALEQSSGSLRLDKFKVPQKIALILGNEVEGLAPNILKSVKHILEIPMAGHKESFNVVQAAAMALYKFRFA